MRRFFPSALFALACFASAAPAQQPAPASPPATPPAAPAATPSAAPAAVAPQVSIEDAYRREFAFLEAQKRELSQRLAETRRQFDAERARLEREVAAVESRVLAARSEVDAINEQLAAADRQIDAGSAEAELVQATLSQALASLASLGDTTASAPEYAVADDAGKLAQVYAAAQRRLALASSVRREPGKFYLVNGDEVEGTLIRIGNIGAYGVSAQGAGALAPAGGGLFKLWPVDSSAAAQALMANQPPATLPLFVFESTVSAVTPPKQEGLLTHYRKGGAVGYVILALGVLAIIFAILRAVFLFNAGASVNRIMDMVRPLVQQGRTADAIEAAKRFKGSAARVVTAALRNVDRDRAHLEDIVSESILHESTHLNRFGALITLIAGVAPLLGLLGTVTGMIQTFDVITEFGTSDPKLLSGGIAVALVTTELGLTVAIPALLAGTLLNGWAETIKDDMEKAALKVVNAYQEAQARPRGKAAA